MFRSRRAAGRTCSTAIGPSTGSQSSSDGRDAHERALAFESDRRKDAALTAIGLRPLRLTWSRVTYEPAELLADLTAAMNASSSPWSRS